MEHRITIVRTNKKKISLTALIDMVLILVIFFLVVNVKKRIDLSERCLVVPAPTNQSGTNANILIQIVGRGRYLWFDSEPAFYDNLSRALKNAKAVADREIVPNFLKNQIKTFRQIHDKISEIPDVYGYSPLFIVIRCPNSLPYGDVIRIIDAIADLNPTPAFGCIGGKAASLYDYNNYTIDAATHEIAIKW